MTSISLNFAHSIIFFLLSISSLTSCNHAQDFIQPVEGRNQGILCLEEEWIDLWQQPERNCFEYTLEAPYLILDPYLSELWGCWPAVYSPSGHNYELVEFTDQVFGYAVQDLCETRIKLVYTSVFGDTAEIHQETYPTAIVIPDYDYLSDRVGYHNVSRLKDLQLDVSSKIQIFLHHQSCFSGGDDVYTISQEKSPRIKITAHGGYGQVDEIFSITPVELAKFKSVLKIASSHPGDFSSTSYYSLYVKSGQRILNLTNEAFNIAEVLDFLEPYKPRDIDETPNSPNG